MNMHKIKKDHRIAPFVKEIFTMENNTNERMQKLPFYADGYPGIMYAQSENKILLLPHEKELSDFFMYGQTIEPIELVTKGRYQLVVFRLYPFVPRLLIGIDPKEINDTCYDLAPLDTHQIVQELKCADIESQVEHISCFLMDLVKKSTSNMDHAIKLASLTIINAKGKITIQQLRERLYITERTFERRFAKEIGVSPKQFANIIRFHSSLRQMYEKDYEHLTDIAYGNGFSDQSHFIRTFKRYTGKTPKQLLS